MFTQVELHQFVYLRDGHLRNPPKLSVGRFDSRFPGMLRTVVCRWVGRIVTEAVCCDVLVTKVDHEYVRGPQEPYVVVCGDEPEKIHRIVMVLEEYFAEQVKVVTVALGPAPAPLFDWNKPMDV